MEIKSHFPLAVDEPNLTGFNLGYATLRLFCPKAIDILAYWQIEACCELLRQIQTDVYWKRNGFFNNSVRYSCHNITSLPYHRSTYTTI